MFQPKDGYSAVGGFVGILVLIPLLASCSTLSEDERAEKKYDREDKLILAREQFEREKRDCQSSGGSMKLRRYSGSKITKPDIMDYRSARCIMPGELIR